MAKVQIVIKIPEEMYKWVNDANKIFNDYGTSDFIDLVKNGTPLPKGHGRLIDADAEIKKWGLDKATKYGNETSEQQHFSYSSMMMYEIADILDDANVILEADKE